MKKTTLLFFLLPISLIAFSQNTDSTKTFFSGSVGLTNNGFSIIPTFSLNSPATIMNFSWRKNRLSFEPDIRLVPQLNKGGLLFWLRYRLVEKKKFSLRIGAHPAFTLVKRVVNDGGVSTQITEMLRFVAGEIVPNYQITPSWSVGAMFLHGNGLQRHGPQNTNVLFLNTNISNLKIGSDFRFQLIPMVFFLNVDGSTGSYFSGTTVISRKNLPFTLQSTINQTFRSNIVGNQDFMWNVLIAYNFSKSYM